MLIGQRMEMRTVQKFQTMFIVALTISLLAYAGSPIVWAFKDADFGFALSTAEAEHIALSRGLHIMIHFINLFLMELAREQGIPPHSQLPWSLSSF